MAIAATAMEIAFWTLILPGVILLLIQLIGGFFYGIGIMFFDVMDLLQSVFRKLAGLGTVWVDGEAEGDILTAILRSNVVIDVLISVSVFALGLVILASIVQMVRLEYNTEGSKNSKEKIFTSALKSLLMFVLIPIVCLVGIRISNYLLRAVDYATSSSGASTISGAIFQASCGSASNIADEKNLRNNINFEDGIAGWFKPAEFTNAHVVSDGSSTWVKYFSNSFKCASSGSTSNNISDKDRVRLAKMVGQRFVVATQTENGYEVGTKLTDLGNDTPWDDTALEKTDSLSYKNSRAVAYFYNTSNINYLILFLGCYICIKALFSATMGMIARIYKVAALFVVAPATIGLQPLDDGSAYKKWKGEFIKNVLSCYGFIVALNLYFMVVGVLQTVELWQGWASWIPNLFMQYLFVLTGATMINGLSATMSSLIGAADALADGEKVAGDVGKMAGTFAGGVAKVGMGAAMGAKGAFRGIQSFAERNVFGAKGTDGKMHTVGGQSRLKARSEKKLAKMEKNYTKAGDSYIDKKGNVISGDEARAIDETIAKQKSNIQSANDNLRLTNLSRRAANAEKHGIQSRMAGNRFKHLVGNSGPVSSFKNLTGMNSVMKVVGGKEFEEVDEKSAKELGVSEDRLKGMGIEAGKSGLRRLLNSVEDGARNIGKRHVAEHAAAADAGAAVSISRAEIEKQKRIEDVINREKSEKLGTAATTANDAYKVAEEKFNKNADLIEREQKNITSRRDEINRLQEEEKSMEGFNKGQASRTLKDLSKNIELAQHGSKEGRRGIRNILTELGYDKNTGDFSGVFKGNQDLLKLMKAAQSQSSGNAFTEFSTDKFKAATIVGNIENASIERQSRIKELEESNKAAVSGLAKYRERQEDLGKNLATLKQDADDATAARDAFNDYVSGFDGQHNELIKQNNGHYDPTEYMKQMQQFLNNGGEGGGKKLADDFANALEKVLNKDALKVKLGLDEKLKIDHQPIVDAIKRLEDTTKSSQEKAATKAKENEVPKLLQELIKEVKKGNNKK